MASMQASVKASGGPSLSQTCVLILIFNVLLLSLGMAVNYIYFTNELKQLQDKYFKSGIACLLKEDDSFWDPSDEESQNSFCFHVKWQLYQFIKMILRNNEEAISTVPEKQQNIPYLGREKGAQRAAAHITGTSRRRSLLPALMSRNEKVLGQKISSWESSRKGHSFLNNLHLRNGELVVHQTGFYYIYAQTYFTFQEPDILGTVSREENRKKNKQMVQYIYKLTSYPDPILLMKSARNSCWSKDSEYGLYSIYQGGLFELKEDDRIFVSVNNDQLIDMDQEASFFGAFLIGFQVAIMDNILKVERDTSEGSWSGKAILCRYMQRAMGVCIVQDLTEVASIHLCLVEIRKFTQNSITLLNTLKLCSVNNELPVVQMACTTKCQAGQKH